MVGRGRGKINMVDIKKDYDKAGPKSSINSESAMDDYLKELDLYRKPVAKDGSCLFRVVAEQIYKTQACHLQVRYECIDYMHQNRHLFEEFIEGSFEHHMFQLRNPKEWGGQVEISALSSLYKCDFIVYQSVQQPPQTVTCNGFAKKIYLCYSNGNHYDAVYPLTFEVDAAVAQSILYDLLLSSVFPEIERREKLSNDSGIVNEHSMTGWTEVKPKQNKGKILDETSDLITSSIPEAVVNQKVFWQIKRSIDPNCYRNIELEVWEDFKTEQQKTDQSLAVSIQFKPGDLCFATIKESRDVSETIRVKIQEISSDKCLVLSENLKNRYYVQLDDLQPIINGDDSYKNLPGYYKKLDEKENDYQSQKRRGKSSRKMRDDEDRQRKIDNGSVRLNDSGKKNDSRNNRRAPRKDIERKKDSEINKNKQKVDLDLKKIEKIEEPYKQTSSLNDSDGAEKVAQPAESSAAFWGRMRTKPLPKPASTLVSPSQPATTTSVEIQEKDDTIVTKTNNFQTDNIKTPQPVKQRAPEKSTSKPAWQNLPSPVITPVTSASYIAASVSQSVAPASLNIVPVAQTVSPITQNVSSVTQIVENVAASISTTVAPNSLSQTKEKKLTSSVTASFSTGSPKEKSTTNTSLNEETQKLFNLSLQASAKVNEVRENIAKVADQTFQENHVSSDTCSVSKTLDQPTNNNSNDDTQAISDQQMNKDSLIYIQQNNATESHKLLLQDLKPKNDQCDHIAEDTVVFEEAFISTIDESGASTVEVSPYEIEFEKSDVGYDSLKYVNKEKTKKKVSFGRTTEIIEKAPPLVTMVPMDTASAMTHSEPGKIILPPEHIEKHINEFPSGHIPDGQQEHVMQQPSFIHTGMSFYAPPPMPTVVPMFCPGGEQFHMPVSFSRDPEGKDLPEDLSVLRHYFNLGVQWQLMMTQSNNVQINQPGILPLPVQTQQMPAVHLRQVQMMTSEPSMRSDSYSVNSQTNDNSHMDLQQPFTMLQGRMQPQQFAIPQLQPTPSYEEYELPPRLRRGPTNRGNARHLPQRQLLNGRGIMGQGPGQRSDNIRGNAHQLYPTF